MIGGIDVPRLLWWVFAGIILQPFYWPLLVTG